jgi:hypothetical protein
MTSIAQREPRPALDPTGNRCTECHAQIVPRLQAVPERACAAAKRPATLEFVHACACGQLYLIILHSALGVAV